MAVDLYSYHQYHEEEDDYIDMEVNSYSNFYCHTQNPSPSPLDPRGEFEFQMSLNSMKADLSTTSPADELFYKGKLLPLHLPPRLQMVEKLISSTSTSSPFHTNKCKASYEEIYSTPLNTNASTTPVNGATPFESCNVSPSESCQVSKELNIEEYLAKYASNDGERADFTSNIPTAAAAVGKKLSWTRKLRLMKQSASIVSKLKASRSYLKIIFRKSGCLDESSSSAAAGVAKNKDAIMNGGNLLSSSGRVQDKEYLNKVDSKHPFRQIVRQITNLDRHDKEVGSGKDGKIRYRRSFSGAFVRRSTANKLSSSSSSLGSSSSSLSSSSNSINNSNDQLLVVKRSSSGSNSEFESPIQGAIAYCKKSQLQVLVRPQKTTSDVGHSLSSSRPAPTGDENKGR